MAQLTLGFIVKISITLSVDNRRSRSTIGALKVDVEVLGGADVFDVGTDPCESRPSVCLESLPLELLSAVLSRSGGGGGNPSLSLSDAVIPRAGGMWGGWGEARVDMGRDGAGE